MVDARNPTGPAGTDALTARLGPLPARAALAAQWQALEASAQATPFTTWAWVDVWLEQLPDGIEPLLFRASDGGGAVGLGLLVASRPGGLRRLLPGVDLHLQETGRPELDELTVEYASLLVRRGREDDTWRAFFECLLRRRGWSRLCLSATGDAARILGQLPGGLAAFSRRVRPAYRVDLDAVRNAGGGYVAQLSKRMRRELARIEGLYTALGPVRVEVARDSATALQWLAGMDVLHTRYWNSRGEPGAFASSFFLRFHQALARRVDDGLVRLSRVSAGGHVIGFAYHLACQENWHFYNAGLDYEVLGGEADRPGFLAQKLLVEAALAEGVRVYEFMAGEQLYKRRLSTGVRQLHDLELRRRGPLLWLEQQLRRRLHKPPLQPLAATLAGGG